jgi:ribokinase
MEPSVLFIGDVNLDIQMMGLSGPILIDHEVFCSGFGRSIGGSTAICAAAYSSLGGSAEFCGVLGDDENGRFVSARLADLGVDLRLLNFTSEEHTGVTVNIVHDSARTQVTYLGTLGLTDETDRAIEELSHFRHLHISGPYGTPRFLPRIAELLAAARAKGLTTSLDTQWGEARAWRYLDAWMPHLTWLFVNELEARSITGEEGVEAAWRKLHDSTPCPIIKLGPRGAFFDDRSLPSPAIQVVDTTGAGDSFAAGFLYANFEMRLGLEEAVSYAAATGALACTYAGGISSSLTKENVQALLNGRNGSGL